MRDTANQGLLRVIVDGNIEGMDPTMATWGGNVV